MLAKIKVCHFTSVHPAKDIRIFYKECVALANAEFDVYLVFQNKLNSENIIEQNVNFVPVNIEKNTRYKRLFVTRKKVYEKALSIDAQIYHFHDSELLPYALKLIKKGKKVIYDAHEDLPRQIMSKHYIPKFLRSTVAFIIEKIENYYASKLTGIIGATTVIEERFKKFNKNTISICNYPSLTEFDKPTKWDNKKNEICYIGGIFDVRGAEEMIKIMPKLNAKLNLAGQYSPDNYKDYLQKINGWEKVNDYGFVDRETIKDILNRSVLGLLLLHPLQSYIDSLPIKLFEYMAAGIPIIASDFQMWKKIIEEGNCGICVNPFDLETITKEINKLLNDLQYAEQLGQNGRKLIEKKYNWENEQQKLINYYKSIIV